MSAYTPSANRMDNASAGQPAAQGASQRYGQRAATAIARFAQPFLYPSRPPSAQGQRDGGSSARDAVRSAPSVHNSSSSGSVSFRSAQPNFSVTDKPITAIDISPDKTNVILAGRDILRTAGVSSDGTLTENINLLRHINVKHREQLAVVDVRWSHHHNSLIATAAGSGRVVIYDLNRPSFEFTTLYEHVRQVHKLAFNPHGGPLFLSGSHDGAIKLWDLRDIRDSRRSKATFQGVNQGIRDVKWSTTDAVEFAAGTDSGIVQRWDMRKTRAPILQLNAHESTCHSIDYHPFGKYLVSAGADRKVKVWDTTRSDRRQNPFSQIQAPQSVLNVCWRPGDDYIKPEGQLDFLAKSVSQIATSYDAKDLRIHLWDLNRPSLPCREINISEGSVSTFIWHSNDWLWAAGANSNQGVFYQADIKKAKQPIDRLNTNVLAIGPGSTMAFFSEHRQISTFALSTHEDLFQKINTDSSSGERFGSSLSATDASFEEPDFATSILSRRRRRTAVSRPNVANSRKEEINLDGEQQDIYIDNLTLACEVPYETQQKGAYGKVHSISEDESFQDLADRYVSPLFICQQMALPKAAAEIEGVFIQNSNNASLVGCDELAHTWRILAWAVRRELEDLDRLSVAENHRTKFHPRQTGPKNSIGALRELNTDPGSHSDSSDTRINSIGMSAGNSGIPSSLSTPKILLQKETLLTKTSQVSQAHRMVEDTATDQTLAEHQSSQATGSVEPVFTVEKLISGSQDKINSEGASCAASYHIIPEFIDTEEQLAARRAAMSTYRLTPRPLLRLDNTPKVLAPSVISGSPMSSAFVGRPDISRYDSGESFDLLSESTGSHKQSYIADNFGEELRSAIGSEGVMYTSRNSPQYSRNRDHSGRQVALIRDTNLSLSNHDQGVSDSLDEFYEAHAISSSGTVDTELHKQTLVPNLNLRDIDLPPRGEIGERLAREDKESYEFSSNETAGNDPEGSASVSYFEHETKPWQASSFLPALLKHHICRLSSLQLPVFLIMYLYRYYHHMFPMKMRSNGNVSRGERNHAISPNSRSCFAAIFLIYHGQLVSLRRYIAAADLRRSCEYILPELQSKTDPGMVKKFWCRNCSKLSKGSKKGFCARCEKRWGTCSVCCSFQYSSKHILYDDKTFSAERPWTSGQTTQPQHVARKRWLYCQTCGHGGHASCVASWLSNPESSGSCCVPGCLHACGPGTRREELRADLTRRKSEMSQLRRGNGVLRDDKIVHESRAVRAARPDALELELGELWSDVSAGVIDMSNRGGIMAESVTGPNFVGAGVAAGRGRWRANRRAGKSSIGTGGLPDSVAGLTDSESDGRRQQNLQLELSNSPDTTFEPGPLRAEDAFASIRGEMGTKNVQLGEPDADNEEEARQSRADHEEEVLSLS